MPLYLRFSGVDLTAIGLYSLIGLPWTLKVLWSPLIDRYGARPTRRGAIPRAVRPRRRPPRVHAGRPRRARPPHRRAGHGPTDRGAARRRRHADDRVRV